MDYGWTSLCLPASDLARSTRFYQALGMQLLDEVDGKRAVLRNGAFRLSLMPFLDAPLLNWRGGDAFAVHASVTARIPDAPGAPTAYRKSDPGFEADADGACWATHDPDGHEILFDTNRLESDEAGRAARIAQILLDAEASLICAGASAACLRALRTEVIDKHTRPASSRPD